MHELMSSLSNICEGKHVVLASTCRENYGDGDETTSGHMRLFRSDRLDTASICKDIRSKIMSPLAPSEVQGHGMGYVYVLRSLNNLATIGEFKIGFSKYHPEHRAHELGRCMTQPEVLAYTPLLPHAKRIESLIHTELVASRKVQNCPQCRRHHREWFTVAHPDAREVVLRWSKWVLQRPYRDGNLDERWRTYLESQDFDSLDPEASVTETWNNIVDKFPRHDSDYSQEERAGVYLNACYYEDLLKRTSGLCNGDFENLLRGLHDYKRLHNGGKAYSVEDLRRSLTEVETFLARGGASGEHPEEESGKHSDEEDADCHIQPTRPQRQTRSMSAKKKEMEMQAAACMKGFEALNAIKTGSMSVVDPDLGITESPLGDATLLPVLSLDELHHFDAQVKSWVGYSPTNIGYQRLQEAYAQGEWMGSRPRFKLPKVFRKAGVKKLSDLPTSSGPRPRHFGDVAPENSGSATEQIPGRSPKSPLRVSESPGASSNCDSGKDGDGDGDVNMDRDADVTKSGDKSKPGFQYVRGGGEETFRWTQPIAEEFKAQVTAMVEHANNGGLPEIDNQLKQILHYHGVDFGQDTDDLSSLGSDTEDSDEEMDEIVGGDVPESLGQGDVVAPIPTTKPEASGSANDAFVLPRDRVKKWFSSL